MNRSAFIAAEIERKCFDRPWNAEDFASALELGAQILFCHQSGQVDRDGQSAIAYCLLRPSVEEGLCEVLRIGVDPLFRRLGLASKLLQSTMGIFGASPYCIKRFILEVSERNTAALDLYAKSGFREYHRRRNYYSDTSDAILMEFVYASP